MVDMKYVWKITGRDALDEADLPQCYVLAGSMREALELASETNGRAIPLVGMTWPGSESAIVFHQR
jgi:hypothetical protein